MKFFVDSSQYHTECSQFYRYQNSNNSAKKRNQIETILTHWSVAQAGLHDEKRGSKISSDCALNVYT